MLLTALMPATGMSIMRMRDAYGIQFYSVWINTRFIIRGIFL